MVLDVDDVINLGKLALAFGRVNRATFHEDGTRHESDTDHTVMLSLIACALVSGRQPLEPDLNVGLVAQFALVHDLVEAKCGDIQSYNITPEVQAQKAAQEAEALSELADEFGLAFPWLIDMMQRYERQEEPEARFVRVLDKAMPKITHTLNQCAALKGLSTPEELERVHQAQLDQLTEEYPEFANTLTLLEALMHRSAGSW